MTSLDHAPPATCASPATAPAAVPDVGAAAGEVVLALNALVRAEAAAEAQAAGTEAADLEQAVWVRLLERRPGPEVPEDPVRWVRTAVRAEARVARRRVRRERAFTAGEAPGDWAGCPERIAVGADERRTLRTAVGRLPGRCPRLLAAMLAAHDPTYREIAGELGMSQGSLGPMRSRCLGCLRRMLAAEVVAPEPRGMER
ncbi:sigma-70 family RNA polymerase sigma factor [[Kitasatospora] papulosa]|uniref:sigma-70 family RNA polymerase sigma factor n=1 Tax=Streptomyces TaxID=1883 RepID=UPI0022596B27|nr:sigma-70 family RNA polymerase sigma factor [[Kitasatospora] papulosa]MCX4413442.1 sigma-70 family RNA polymerase sigma factor [[Kitasatospora] papulosa]